MSLLNDGRRLQSSNLIVFLVEVLIVDDDSRFQLCLAVFSGHAPYDEYQTSSPTPRKKNRGGNLARFH